MKTKMSPNGAALQYAYWVWSLDYVCCVVFIRWGICVLGIVPLLRSSILLFVRVYPGFCSCLWHSRHPELCRSVALKGSLHAFVCVFPGFHFGLCPHSTLGYAGVPPFQGSLHAFVCVYPGFHIGLCPHSTLGYAGVSPRWGFSSDWAFAVLRRGIVFVKCV